MRFLILMSLCAGLSCAQSYIGVGMQEVESGVEVTAIVPDSPAEKAGLKVGDIVRKFGLQKVEGNEQFARLVRDTPSGREVKLEINRAGTVQWISMRLAPRKTAKIEWNDNMQPTNVQPMNMPFEIRMPDMSRGMMTLRSSALGVEVESVDGQLAQYFGVKEGLLVRSVTKGASADKAGMRAGDVMIKLDDARVATPADLSNKLRALRGKSVPAVVMRDHKEVSLTVLVEEEAPMGTIQITPFQVHPQP